MAGHFPLKKQDEPALFAAVENIKNRAATYYTTMEDFQKKTIMFKSSPLTMTKLPKDFAENPESEIAFTIGKVNLKSIADEHPSLTRQIDVEVHLALREKKIEIKNIFWIA